MTDRERTLALVARLGALSLAELEATAALTTRHDRKYLATWAQAAALVAAVGDDHLALEIDGRRSFTYDTVYYDSADLLTFRAHVQGRRRRFKVRVRSYVDSGRHSVELKLKGRRGETVKHRSGCADPADPFGAEARRFLDERLHEAYGQRLPEALHPTVRTRYERMTLVGRDGGSRVTCDSRLHYPAGDATGPLLSDDHVILEVKCADPGAPVLAALRELGVRPSPLSKYALGVGLRALAPVPPDLRRAARTLFTTGEAPHAG